MAPEQAKPQQIDARTDIFSLGVVLFELVSGQRLFPKDTIQNLILERPFVDETMRTKAPLNPIYAICPSLVSILQRCLQGQPENRYMSARALALHLRTLLSRMTTENTANILAA